MNRIFFDTEFIEDGKTIDLISIGLCDQNGNRVFYAENAEADLSKANDFVKANVIPHLLGETSSRKEIAEAVLEWVNRGDGKPEFWGYYADYDWVVLCQLFGTMMDLPKGWPMYCQDLKQFSKSLGDPDLKQFTLPGPEHHALSDALWNAQAWNFLEDLRISKIGSFDEIQKAIIQDLDAWKQESLTENRIVMIKDRVQTLAIEYSASSDLLETAWGIIANAWGGDWELAPEDWREAARRFRDEWLARPRALISDPGSPDAHTA